MSHLTVEPLRGSSLVSVSFDSPDPNLSAAVVNAVAKNFITSNLNRRFQATAYAREFLQQQIENTRLKLEASERALVAYAAQERIINYEVGSGNKDSRSFGGPIGGIDRSARAQRRAQRRKDRSRASRSPLPAGSAQRRAERDRKSVGPDDQPAALVARRIAGRISATVRHLPPRLSADGRACASRSAKSTSNWAVRARSCSIRFAPIIKLRRSARATSRAKSIRSRTA